MSFTFRHQTREISGKEFNRLIDSEGLTLIRLFTKNEIHNNYQYTDGLNIDPIPFDPSGSCKSGGFYFFIEQEFDCDLFMRFISFRISHMRKIYIPDDARVYIEGRKCKADQIILGERIECRDYPGFREMCANIVYTDLNWLKVIPRDLIPNN